MAAVHDPTVDLPRIDSPTNPRVKAWVRLRKRRERDRTGTVPVEGARESVRALAAGRDLVAAYFAPELWGEAERGAAATLRASGVPCWRLSPAAFARGSVREGPDGIATIVRPPAHALDDLDTSGPAALVVIAVGTQKPGNLGALVRSADAAGATALVASGSEGTDPWNPAAVRASMGAVFELPVATAPDRAVRDWARRRGLTLVATAPDAERSYWDADLRGPTAIVLGPEHEGLPTAWRDAADLHVRVPMEGARSADSLNVGVTGALVAFEAARQRRHDRPTAPRVPDPSSASVPEPTAS